MSFTHLPSIGGLEFRLAPPPRSTSLHHRHLSNAAFLPKESKESKINTTLHPPASSSIDESLASLTPRLHSSRSFIVAQLVDHTKQSISAPTASLSTFQNEPDDCDLLPGPTPRPRFVRVMTAITDMTDSDVGTTRESDPAIGYAQNWDHDTEPRAYGVHIKTRSRKLLGLPPAPSEALTATIPSPWATAAVDRLICFLDTRCADTEEIIRQVKRQFPQLGGYVIKPQQLHKRLMILDQRVDVDYFRADLEAPITSAGKKISLGPNKQRRKGSGQPIIERILPDVDGLLVAGYQRDMLNTKHEEESLAAEQVESDQTLVKGGDDRAHNNIDRQPDTGTIHTNIQDDVRDRPADDQGDGEEDEDYEIYEPDFDVNETRKARAVKHGLAIHGIRGYTSGFLNGDNQVKVKSVRKLDTDRDPARARAVKLGLAIHQDRGSVGGWMKEPAKKLTKARRWKIPSGTTSDPTENRENIMPTPLFAGGAMVGIAPSGSIKSTTGSLDSRKNGMLSF